MFHSDWGRVIGRIKQNELDYRDTAPLTRFFFFSGHSEVGVRRFCFLTSVRVFRIKLSFGSIRFQAEGEIGVPDGKERLEAKEKTYKNPHQKMMSGLKRNRRCEASSVDTSPLF